MTGVKLTYSEGLDGSRQYQLSISRQALESVDLDKRSRKLLDIQDDDLLVSDKLWKLGNIIRRLERQHILTMVHEGTKEAAVTRNVFEEKDSIDP